MSIPGLSFVETEKPNEPVVHDVEQNVDTRSLTLFSFDMKEIQIPDHHMLGNCRHISEFERIDLLGEGTFGTVYKANDLETNKIVAIKKIKTDNEGKFTAISLVREVNNLTMLKHPNIISLIDVAVGKKLYSNYLVLEFCPFSLAKVIDEGDLNLLKHPEVKCIMLQLFSGLDCIHKHSLLHRDISVSNILFTEEGVLKIIDFGLSRKYTAEILTPNVGVQWYRAPELLFGSQKYTSAIDIWSAGCIFAELLRKKPLFDSTSDASAITMLIDCLGSPSELVWPGFTKLPVCKNYDIRDQPINHLKGYFDVENHVAYPLVQKILQYNPKARPSAEECMKHGYFTENPLACSLDKIVLLLNSTKAY